MKLLLLPPCFHLISKKYRYAKQSNKRNN